MSETLQYSPEQSSQNSHLSDVPMETVYHGTSIQAAESILSEGFKVPKRQDADKSEHGPTVWFGTDEALAHPYGRDIRERSDDGVLRVVPHDENAPSYAVIIEAKIPQQTDSSKHSENGIHYAGELRLVSAHGMGHLALSAMRLYMYPPGAPYGTVGTLIDEHVIGEKPSLLKRIKSDLRHKRNVKLGRPTLRK